MKHLFIALSILAATFTLTLVACTKKDWLPNDQKITRPVPGILAGKSDTPYGKTNIPIDLPVIAGPGIKIIPAAKGDTPYGKINIPKDLPVIAGPRIKIIPVAKGDTPYGKINIPLDLPIITKPGIRIIPAATSDTPYGKRSVAFIKPGK